MSLAVAAGSGILVSGGSTGGGVQLREFNGRELGSPVVLQKTNDSIFSVREVACSPDGRLAAAAHFDGSLRVWELPGGRLRVSMKGHTNRIWSVVFLDEGRTLASIDEANDLKFWDAVTGQERMSVRLSGIAGLQRLAFAPQEQMLIASGGNVLHLVQVARDKAALAVKSELDADDHTSPVARMSAGDLLWAAGRTEEARATYAEAHARLGQLAGRFPNVPDYRYEQTRCAFRLALLPAQEPGHAGAVELPREVPKQFDNLSEDRRQDFARSLAELSEALMTAGRSGDAERAYGQALAIGRKLLSQFPNDAMALQNAATTYRLWGLWLQKAGRLTEAEQVLREALGQWEQLSETHPELKALQSIRSTTLEGLACVLSQGGQSERAAEIYDQLLRINSGSAAACNNLAWFLATCPDKDLRNPDRAVEFAQKAVELAPKDGSNWNTLGVAQYRAGDWKGAIESLHKSQELTAEATRAYDGFFLAMAHGQLGDKEQARKWHEKAVEWMEKNANANEELQRFRLEAEELLELEKKTN
jgi:tetratricopeptide (TPR) repeat protein